MALEYFELAEAILNGREIEVDGMEGLKDVAAVYAIFESSRLGRTVKLSEVESGAVYEYQAEIGRGTGYRLTGGQVGFWRPISRIT